MTDWYVYVLLHNETNILSVHDTLAGAMDATLADVSCWDGTCRRVRCRETRWEVGTCERESPVRWQMEYKTGGEDLGGIVWEDWEETHITIQRYPLHVAAPVTEPAP